MHSSGTCFASCGRKLHFLPVWDCVFVTWENGKYASIGFVIFWRNILTWCAKVFSLKIICPFTSCLFSNDVLRSYCLSRKKHFLHSWNLQWYTPYIICPFLNVQISTFSPCVCNWVLFDVNTLSNVSPPVLPLTFQTDVLTFDLAFAAFPQLTPRSHFPFESWPRPHKLKPWSSSLHFVALVKHDTAPPVPGKPVFKKRACLSSITNIVATVSPKAWPWKLGKPYSSFFGNCGVS